MAQVTEWIAVIADQPETYPPMNENFLTINVQRKIPTTPGQTELCLVQYDANVGGFFDEKNHRVGLKAIAAWERIRDRTEGDHPAQAVGGPSEDVTSQGKKRLKKKNFGPKVNSEFSKLQGEFHSGNLVEATKHIIADLAMAGLPMLGFYEPKVEKDRYNNDVSLLHMPSFTYRMVHQAPKHARAKSRLYLIYAGPGKFVRVQVYHSDDPCAAHTIDVGGYNTSWGDGDCLGCSDNFSDEQKAQVKKIPGDSDVAFILYVLSEFSHREDFWQKKEVKTKTNSAGTLKSAAPTQIMREPETIILTPEV